MSEQGRAVGYARVSTQEQAEEGCGMKDQVGRLKKVDEIEFLELIDIVEDRGETGTNLEREGLQRILNLARNGEIDYVVVVRLDRLSRDMLDTLHVLRVLRENEVKVGILE